MMTGMTRAILIYRGFIPGSIKREFQSKYKSAMSGATQILFSIGLATILGGLNVFFRDVGQLFSIVLQFRFWLTPIVYPVAILPENIQPLISWNPMALLITAYQTILVNGTMPLWSNLVPIAILSIVLCATGMQLFRKRSGEMVDEL